MSDQKGEIGVLILGNPGAGKTFLLNTLLGYKRFAHRCSVRSVTTTSEFVSITATVGGQDVPVLLWNLQGTFEPCGANMDRNRADLSRAFRSGSAQIAVFLLRACNGRLRQEDIALFIQLMSVYQLDPKSTVVLLNSNGTEPTAWSDDAKMLFIRLTGFHGLQHWTQLTDILLPVGGTCTFQEDVLKINAAVVRLLLAKCTPRRHEERGRIEFEEENIHRLRIKIEQVRAEMENARSKYKLEMEQIKSRMRIQADDSAESDRRHEESCSLHRTQMENLATEVARREKEHAAFMTDIRGRMEEVERYKIKLWIEEQERNAYYHCKRKRGIRKFGTVLRHIVRHPLKLAPIVVAVAIPYAAPMVATSLGVSTTAASVGMYTVVGGGCAAIQNENLLKGAVCGALQSFVPFVAPTGVSVIATSAICAAIQEHDILPAIIGSAMGAIVDTALTNMSGSVTRDIMTRMTSSVTHAAVSRSDLTEALAMGVVEGVIRGISRESKWRCEKRTSRSLFEAHGFVPMKGERDSGTIRMTNVASKEKATATSIRDPIPKFGPRRDWRLSPAGLPSYVRGVYTTPRWSGFTGLNDSRFTSYTFGPSGTLTRGTHSRIVSDLEIGGDSRPHLSFPPQYRGSHSEDSLVKRSETTLPRSKVVLSSKGISASVDGGYVAPKGIGFTVSNGNRSTRYTVSPSGIYKGGIVFSSAISITMPTRNSPSLFLISFPGEPATYAVQPETEDVTEQVGRCWATRTAYQCNVSSSNVTHTLVNEYHYNTEGCFGDPARAGLTAAVLMGLPEIALPGLINAYAFP